MEIKLLKNTRAMQLLGQLTVETKIFYVQLTTSREVSLLVGGSGAYLIHSSCPLLQSSERKTIQSFSHTHSCHTQTTHVTSQTVIQFG